MNGFVRPGIVPLNDAMLALAWVDPPTRFVRFFSRDGREFSSVTQAQNITTFETALTPDDREFFLGTAFERSASGFALVRVESASTSGTAAFVRIEHGQRDPERRKRVIASVARQLDVPPTSDLARTFTAITNQGQGQDRIEIRLLGGGVYVNGRNAPLPRRSLEVLTALALSRGAVSREVLHDALWEDDEPATARTALNVHVCRVRRALGNDAIVSDDGAYRLGPGVSVDLHDIEETLRTASPAVLSSAERDVLDRALAALSEAVPSKCRGTLAAALQSRICALARRIGERLSTDVPTKNERFRERALSIAAKSMGLYVHE